ncbi:hypothetical protein [Bacteroides acidifaciens]|uniref:hypothetical protein n=1 Tax=Bacteroides acidifaciens TaxID=85831 RepID=UPI00242EBE35|nr:hypothetical protein [Bacteroides acidifaciens]
MPETGGTPATGKILRGCRAFWLTFDNENWTCLGKDTDDLSMELNPDTEQVKNVQGEVTFVNNGYTPTLSNDSYIARREDAIYPHIQTIADTLATDDERTSATLLVATLTEEVKESTTKTLTGKGFTVPVKVTVDSDGGSTSGYAIPFTVSEDGGRTQGTVSVSNKVPTFTPEGGTSPAALSEPAQTKSTSKSNLS